MWYIWGRWHEMQRNSTHPTPDTILAARELSLGGLIIALGIVTPIAFHALGSGPVWLPMHLPILAGAMLLSPAMAALVAAITPVVSAALTGMPPISPPIALFMAPELAVIALAASLLHRRARVNPWLSALGAILCGRLFYAFELFVLAPVIGINLPAAAAGAAALLRGLPGICVQLIVVPPIVAMLERPRTQEHNLPAAKG